MRLRQERDRHQAEAGALHNKVGRQACDGTAHHHFPATLAETLTRCFSPSFQLDFSLRINKTTVLPLPHVSSDTLGDVPRQTISSEYENRKLDVHARPRIVHFNNIRPLTHKEMRPHSNRRCDPPIT